jgi:hypothetical protein
MAERLTIASQAACLKTTVTGNAMTKMSFSIPDDLAEAFHKAFGDEDKKRRDCRV